MLGRNKNPQSAPQPPIGERPVTPTIESVQSKSYSEEVRDRIKAYRTAQTTFLREASERGVPDTDLAGLLADAMTAKVVPRILTGMSFRGNGVHLLLLDGQIPASALEVQVDRRSDGTFDRAFTDLAAYPSTSENEDVDPFTITKTGRLPQMDHGETVDHTVLKLIDDHLITPEQ